ncbi:hypothetical protein M3Y95_01107700 [Aphelenchoides besseyi]|nr:hypothetical protein M3Y95_01107700 [Aphelenchoides besseyi]
MVMFRRSICSMYWIVFWLIGVIVIATSALECTNNPTDYAIFGGSCDESNVVPWSVEQKLRYNVDYDNTGSLRSFQIGMGKCMVQLSFKAANNQHPRLPFKGSSKKIDTMNAPRNDLILIDEFNDKMVTRGQLSHPKTNAQLIVNFQSDEKLPKLHIRFVSVFSTVFNGKLIQEKGQVHVNVMGELTECDVSGLQSWAAVGSTSLVCLFIFGIPLGVYLFFYLEQRDKNAQKGLIPFLQKEAAKMDELAKRKVRDQPTNKVTNAKRRKKNGKKWNGPVENTKPKLTAKKKKNNKPNERVLDDAIKETNHKKTNEPVVEIETPIGSTACSFRAYLETLDLNTLNKFWQAYWRTFPIKDQELIEQISEYTKAAKAMFKLPPWPHTKEMYFHHQDYFILMSLLKCANKERKEKKFG